MVLPFSEYKAKRFSRYPTIRKKRSHKSECAAQNPVPTLILVQILNSRSVECGNLSKNNENGFAFDLTLSGCALLFMLRVGDTYQYSIDTSTEVSDGLARDARRTMNR